MKQVYLLDFEDSFTFNIASIVTAMGFDVQVIPLQKIKEFLSELNPITPVAIIYGPGPGHPDEYNYLFSEIRRLLKISIIFHFGICLGHQILGLLQGHQVVPCAHPIHGSTSDFIIPPWDGIFEKEDWGQTLKVQKYNSLCLDSGIPGDECLARRFPGGVSFQFHPESVGTSSPETFFKSLTIFFRNAARARCSCCRPTPH